ncbi:MAG: FGGY-family carbohydrate kinase [Janthinobacterium lividum]
MDDEYLIGLDYGSESARGVLVDARTGRLAASHTHAYRHGVMSEVLPDGTRLPPFWALQVAADYTEAATAILTTLGRGRRVRGIGIGFTACSPLPALDDGTPLSAIHPGKPHAYVKLWKHAAAQPWADRITEAGGSFLDEFGGKLSSNSLTAKAAEMVDEAPDLWAESARFIEAGDWLVWQITGVERRSYAFATYKAQYASGAGYPSGLVPGLSDKLGTPVPVGTAAGELSPTWRERTGILGPAVVAVAVIDSHVVMPAVGAVAPGTLVGALGTSAVYLLLDDVARPLPRGIEGVAADATLRGLRCFEAGQASFGDMLAWFVREFPRGDDVGDSFDRYDAAARALEPGSAGIVALDWFNGNRVPHGDAHLSGMLAGLTLRTTAAAVYRALLEALCFGARRIIDLLEDGGAPVDRVILTSGLSLKSPLLMQLMADILGRAIHVPQREHLTAVGAAIHGAVAAGVVRDFTEGARRFGETEHRVYRPDVAASNVYLTLYSIYRTLGDDPANRDALHRLAALKH